MEKQKKSRKPLIVGILTVVVVLAILLALLLTQCTGGRTSDNDGTTVPTTTAIPSANAEGYTLYWNVDRDLYDGKSEAGMSSRSIEADGYFHVRFAVDGRIVTYKVADRKVVNAIEVMDVMGLEFDANGIVVGAISIDDMPCEKTAWGFYVQSAAPTLIKVNSSNKFNGMEILVEVTANTGIYDMTGLSGEVGCVGEPAYLDRVYIVSNEAGEVTHIFIYNRGNYMTSHEGECEHCGKVVTWYEWTKDTTLPTAGGHYQLQNNVVLTGQQNIAEDAKICLDLNGYTVDGKDGKRVYALYNVGAELALMDTSEAQTGKLAAHGTGDQGMVVWCRYGVYYQYSGTLDASDATTLKGGTALYVAKNTYAYINGGEIIGGTSMWVYNAETGKYTQGLSGSVHVIGKLVINDGVIRDGVAKSASYTTSSGTVKYERGIGGNIFVSSGGVLEMNGGVIKNGVAGVAGNIYLDGTSEFTMNGGSILGGVALDKGRNGGSISISSKSIFRMNGGYISGGTSHNTAGNVYCSGTFIMAGGVITNGKCLNFETKKENTTHASRNLYVVNGDFQMYGGQIYGSAAAVDTAEDDDTCLVVLSGYATIKGGPEGTPNLSLLSSGDTVKVIVGQMLDGSSVGVTTSYGIFTEPCKDHNTDNFFSDVEGSDVIYYEGCLALGKLSCLCGSNSDNAADHMGQCDGTQHFWGPWTSSSSLPSTDGYYYLTKDVSTGKQTTIGSSTNGDVTVNLNLNGKTVSVGNRAYLVYGTLNIVDHVGGGVLSGTGPTSGKDHTGVILQGGSSSVYLYGGTLKLAENHYNLSNGGVFGISATSTLTIYGGTIDGSNASGTRTTTETVDEETVTTTVNTTVANGGAIRLNGKLVVQGGTIIGGASTESGGAIYADGANAVIEMTGGTITGGTTRKGGAINMNNGVLNISGGTVQDGTTTSSHGGNVYVAAAAVLNLSGGEIKNGNTWNLGGNIYVNGTVNMTGGTISGGTKQGTETAASNAAFVNGDLTMSGGTIDGHVAFTNYNDATGCVITLSGSPVISGDTGIQLTALDTEADDGITTTQPVIHIEGELSDEASIGMLTTGVISSATVEANLDNFIPDNEEHVVTLTEDGCIHIGEYVDPSTHIHCLCGVESDDPADHIGGCDGTKLRWTDWDGKSAITNSGNYCLTGNAEIDARFDIAEGLTVNICLDRNTITSTTHVIRSYANLSICDPSGKGALIGAGKENDHTGTLLVMAGEFNLYGGALKVSENHHTLANCGVLYITGGATANIYGGTVDGSNAVTAGNGGAIYIRSTSTLNVEGGEIIGGSAVNGGAIYMHQADTLTVSGGTITGGNATDGGTIYANNAGSKITISGGTITGGNASNNGGNIYTKGTLTITDGSIADGTSKNGNAQDKTANVYLINAKLVMSGGSIDGYVLAYSTSGNGSSVELSGSARITGGKTNLKLMQNTGTWPSVTITGALNDDFLVGITAEGLTDAFAKAGTGVTLTEADAKHFYGDNGEDAVLTADGTGLILQAGQNKVACVCGERLEENEYHSHEYIIWTPWTSTDSLPSGSGNYYLTENVTLTGQVNFTSETVLNLDLNDCTVTGWSESGKRVFRLFDGNATDNTYTVVLNITDNGTDPEKEGTITSAATNAENGTILWITEKTQTVSIYGGVLDASNASAASEKNGVAICVGRGTLNIYGGTIKGAETTGFGGAIALTYNNNGATMNMYGGEIIGSTALGGGAIYVEGEENNTTFTMLGGTIQGGIATGSGGNLYITGATVTIGGTAVISGGQATGNNGGNIYVADDSILTIKGFAQIKDGEARKSGKLGGNIYAISNSVVNLQEDAVISGGESHGPGGNLYIGAATFNMSGGTVQDGVRTGKTNDANANMHVRGGTFNMSGGLIKGYVQVHNTNATMDSKVNISGTAQITGGATNLRLYWGNGYTKVIINAGILEEGAEIYITYDGPGCAAGDVVVQGLTSEEQAGYFHLEAPVSYTLTTQKTIGAETFEMILADAA